MHATSPFRDERRSERPSRREGVPLDRIPLPIRQVWIDDHASSPSAVVRRANSPVSHLLARGARPLETARAEVYALDGFLDGALCDALASLVRQHLRPSSTTTDAPNYRTSTTCDLELVEDARGLTRIVDRRISEATGIVVSSGEGLQGQRYLPGEKFDRHFDYFVPGTDCYERFARAHGQRTWTVMVYLSDVLSGGATRFLRLGFGVVPKKGMALAWNNLDRFGQPNPWTEHAGEPLGAGEKVIVTKWFRQERGAS